nr:MAG TPA: hypothetical protein [Caudoviricetes sp.]
MKYEKSGPVRRPLCQGIKLRSLFGACFSDRLIKNIK